METWRPVLKYEEYYEVSDLGRLRRIKGGPGTRLGQIRRPSRHRCGYHLYILCTDSIPRGFYAHRLIWEAFNGPISSRKMQINHKNGDKSDNRLCNIELVTVSQNAMHARTMLGFSPIPPKPMFGSSHPNSLITEQQALKIREMFASGITQTKIANLFGVHQTTVSDIVRRKSWRHINAAS